MSNHEMTTQSNDNKNDLRRLVQSDAVKKQLATALPSYFTPEQFATIVRTSINRNPKLLECTPESFMVALLTAAQMGIAPDGRHGHLIPRWNGQHKCMQVTFQDDYKGLISLVRRATNTADVYAELVCEHDTFELKKGLHRDLVHDIDIRRPRGEIIGAYAVISYKDAQSPSFEFMSREEIERVRERSESWKRDQNRSPWSTDEGEMFKKTVLRRLFKTADLGYELSERISYSVEEPVSNGSAEPEIASARVVSSVEQKSAPAKALKSPEELNRWERAALTRKLNKERAEREGGEPATNPTPAASSSDDDEPGTVVSSVETRAAAEKKDLFGEDAGDEDSLVAQVRRILREHNYSEATLVKVAIENGWGLDASYAKAPLSHLPEEFLTAFVENWEIDSSVREALDAESGR